jgi:hypothetical protein
MLKLRQIPPPLESLLVAPCTPRSSGRVGDRPDGYTKPNDTVVKFRSVGAVNVVEGEEWIHCQPSPECRIELDYNPHAGRFEKEVVHVEKIVAELVRAIRKGKDDSLFVKFPSLDPILGFTDRFARQLAIEGEFEIFNVAGHFVTFAVEMDSEDLVESDISASQNFPSDLLSRCRVCRLFEVIDQSALEISTVVRNHFMSESRPSDPFKIWSGHSLSPSVQTENRRFGSIRLRGNRTCVARGGPLTKRRASRPILAR